MSRRSNLHTHSVFSDGEDQPEVIVKAAIQKGMAAIGFSEHGWTPYDSECCIKKEDIPSYFDEIQRLKRKYEGQIEVYIGIENDYYCQMPRRGLDYVIGSVHYFLNEATGEYINVDYKPEAYERVRDELFHGDVYSMISKYLDLVVDMAENGKPDIIGHIDLYTKLNAGNRYFNESDIRYKRIIEKAVERIRQLECIIEVNTGAIARGYRTTPYPSEYILHLIKEANISITLSSDAHSASDIDFWFDEAEEMLKQIGFRSTKQLDKGNFVDFELA